MTEITLSAKDRFLKKENLQKTLVVIETGFIFFFVPFYFLMVIASEDSINIFVIGLMALICGIASFLLVAAKYENDVEELKNEIASLKQEKFGEEKSQVNDLVITKLQKKILIGLNGLGLIFIVCFIVRGVDELFHEIPKLYESAIVLRANYEIDLVKKDRERLRQYAVSKVLELQLQVNRLEAEKSGKGL